MLEYPAAPPHILDADDADTRILILAHMVELAPRPARWMRYDRVIAVVCACVAFGVPTHNPTQQRRVRAAWVDAQRNDAANGHG